jgi:hypothetical protein
MITIYLFRRFAAGIASLAFLLLPDSAFALGSTPVTVVNPADIAKAEGIQTPFSTTLAVSFSGPNSVSVPANVRWVIENAGYLCITTLQNQFLAHIELDITTSGNPLTFYLPVLTPQPFDQGALGLVWSTSTPVRWYADPGSSVVLNAIKMDVATGQTFAKAGTCTASLSGQAVSVP